MVKKIRVGIVGAGENTITRHIPGLLAIDGVEIVSVCNRSLESSKRVCKEFAIESALESWQDLVAADDIDAIVIGTWPYLHRQITEFALAHNKHVLCEARMAMNLQEALSMLAASEAKPHLVAQLVPAPDTLRVDATIKKLLDEGFLGDLLAINVRAGNTFLDKESALHWRQDVDLVGLNYLSLGVWYESIVRLVGPATSVTAKGKVFVTSRTDSLGAERKVTIPEHIDVITDMECGAQAHFQISKVTGLAGPSEAFLFGSQGTIKIMGGNIYCGEAGAKELKLMELAKDLEGRWRVEEEFIGAIRGEEKIRFTKFADGVRYMQFTEAVAESLELKREVTVPQTLASVGAQARG